MITVEAITFNHDPGAATHDAPEHPQECQSDRPRP
jgi:hypothetical protein